MNAFFIVALALVASAAAQEDGSYRPEVHEAPFAYRGEGEAESHPAPEPQQQGAPQQVQYAQQPSFGNFGGFPFNVQVPQVQAQQYAQVPQQQYVQQAQPQYVQQAQQQYVQQAQPQYAQQAQQQAEDGSYRPDLYEAPYAYRGEQ